MNCAEMAAINVFSKIQISRHFSFSARTVAVRDVRLGAFERAFNSASNSVSGIVLAPTFIEQLRISPKQSIFLHFSRNLQNNAAAREMKPIVHTYTWYLIIISHKNGGSES